MSNYPGYPLPFSTWDPYTPSLRHPFPVGGLHIPGLAPSVHSLTDPAFRAPVVDPFSPLSLPQTSHLSPGLSRYLLGVNDYSPLGVEPLYGFGPHDPHGLLLSPSLSFSQNPSPLTFDQIYRSGASSVSPVSQYRNHFDDRGLSSRFAVPGRFSEPIRRDLPFPSNPLPESRDKFALPKKCDVTEKHDIPGKSVKLWKPFDTESEKEKIDKNKPEHSKLESSFSIESLTRQGNNNKCVKETVDANGNNVSKATPDKVWPEKPVPLRPVPVFSLPRSDIRHSLGPSNPVDKLTDLVSTGKPVSRGDSVKAKLDIHKELNATKKNFSESCNTNKIATRKGNESGDKIDSPLKSETITIESDDEPCVVDKSDSESGVNDIIEVKDIERNSSELKEQTSACFQESITSADQVVPYVECKREKLKELHVSLPKLELNIPQTQSSGSISSSDTTEAGSNSKQDELCSPPVNAKHTKTHSPNKNRTSKKNELLQLSIQVNEVRNRRTSKDSRLLSPTITSPTARRDSCASDKVLSQPIETVGKSKNKSSKVIENRRLSLPILGRSSGTARYLARMSSAEGAITMLKNTEDSLSASVSSSHLSESDSDTQLSNDNADKLFPESQSLNTHQRFSSPQSVNTGYMSTLAVDNMTHDNQYYKPNTPQLCQNESDNQKPYHCVQGQMFHEKPEVLPPYSCFSTNQSPNVLPREPGFHSQEENSNFPPSLSGVESSMDYDENSVMSDSSQLRPPRCDSHSSISHGADSMSCKDNIIPSNAPVANQEQPYHSMAAQDEGTWDFMHSKQYIENIYGHQIGCEIVKSVSDELRESDSPKTFIDLDKTTKEKKAQETHKDKFKDGFGPKHFGKALMRPGYPGMPRPGMYGNQTYDNYSHMAGSRWSSFNRNEMMMGNQPRPDGYGSGYEHTNQYRNSYQANFPNMGQSQNGGDKPFNNQPAYHGNEFNQNEYYNQNPQMKNFQGNYGNARFDNGYYQNRAGNDFNSQNNVYPPNPGEIPGPRFPSQGYSGGQNNYSQHYGQQPAPHCGPETQGQYPESTGFSIPRNASPASTGSDFPVMEAPGGVPPKKKRGRKRKVEKEPPDENKPRPNTFVMAPTKLGPLVDIDNPESTLDTYDYNNQIETIFNFNIEDDMSPIGAQYLQIEQRLCQKLLPIKYGYPVTVIYSPLTYAFQTHRDFVVKYCTSERTLMFLGMNPGPYGMSQNGVRKFCFDKLCYVNCIGLI